MDKIGSKKEPEPKINNFGSATLQILETVHYNCLVGSFYWWWILAPFLKEKTTLFKRSKKWNKHNFVVIGEFWLSCNYYYYKFSFRFPCQDEGPAAHNRPGSGHHPLASCGSGCYIDSFSTICMYPYRTLYSVHAVWQSTLLIWRQRSIVYYSSTVNLCKANRLVFAGETDPQHCGANNILIYCSRMWRNTRAACSGK